MLFFLDADAAYARWAARHPGGFVVDVRCRAGGTAQPLHRARCPDLAPPAAAADGVAPPRHPRACATDRAELEAWADWEGYSLVYCRGCGCEAAWLADQFGPVVGAVAEAPGPA